MTTAETKSGARESTHLLLTSLGTALLLLLAMPGRLGWWPLLFIALVPLFLFVLAKGPRQSFTAGLLAGFFYQAGMLYWIVIVLGRYGGLPLALAVPAMLLLAVYMSLYVAVFSCLVSYFLSGTGPGGKRLGLVLIFAPALWVGLDWVRSFLFSGFPWMDLGYGLYSRPVLLQAADLGGHHLLTFLVVLVNTLFFLVAASFRQGWRGESGAWTRPAGIAAMVLLILAGCYSVFRYGQVSRAAEGSPGLLVALVQGNIPQDEKWTPARKEATLDVYRSLAAEAAAGKKPSLVVWPETALPFFPVNDPLFGTVTGWAADQDVWLLTGAPFFVLHSDLERTFTNAVSYYNSALLIRPSGEVAGRYDKQHLVPFGEYVPLRSLLPFLEPLVESVGNFSFGISGAPLSMGKVKLGILICYESIFPSLARDEVAAGADVLVNITNDAWYGRSSAPYQSFAMSVLRAVETRRSLVRAANTGISGFVDPAGRILAQSPIFEALSLVSSIPVMGGKTVFVRFGHRFAPACLLLSILLLAVRIRNK